MVPWCSFPGGPNLPIGLGLIYLEPAIICICLGLRKDTASFAPRYATVVVSLAIRDSARLGAQDDCSGLPAWPPGQIDT
jgi:hypothetical protein